jgi:replicative DNA helicase
LDDILTGRDTGRIPTGLVCLDNVLLGGLAPSTVTVIAGATGSGKSVALQQIGENAARQGKRVLFIAVEMNAVQLSFRALARLTKLEATNIRMGKLSPEDQKLISHVINDFANLPMHYKDSGSMSTSGIYEAVLEIQKEFGTVDMIVADYIQILEDEQGGGNENMRLTGISRALANIGREFNCPILVGSQLSRESIKRNRRPIPQDLRDSGSIENDATTIILLHSEFDPESGTPAEEIEPITWIVGKNRNGLQGVEIHMNFLKPQQKFVELPPKQQGIAGQGISTEQHYAAQADVLDLEALRKLDP